MKHYNHVIKNNKTHLVDGDSTVALCKTTIKPFSGRSHARKATKCSVCFAARKNVSVQIVIDKTEEFDAAVEAASLLSKEELIEAAKNAMKDAVERIETE